MVNQFHLIKGTNNVNVAFHSASSTIIDINDFVYDVIKLLQNGQSINEISQSKEIESKSLEIFLDKFYNSIVNKVCEDTTNKAVNSIGRITLHVTNDCNLRCTYCYANGGSYNQERKLMNEKTANDFIDFFTKRFDIIENIVFFGGEPLMNLDIIEIICDKFKSLKLSGKLQELPTFGIITNGTILNSRVLNLINKHISFITVSVDGWKDINDVNRKFPDGNGSYDKISDFIKTVQRETKVTLRFEATITDEHKKHEINETLISEYLFKEFGFEGSIAPDIFIDLKTDGNNDYEDKLEIFSKKSDNDNVFLHDGFSNVLRSIIHNSNKEMCPVGRNIVSVSVDGDVYPCHISTGKEHLSLGSIYSNNIFDDPKYYFDKFPYLNALLKGEMPCIECWANKICGGCAVRWFFDYANDNYRNQPNEILCAKNKKYIERVILEITKIKKDKINWDKFIKRLKITSQVSCD